MSNFRDLKKMAEVGLPEIITTMWEGKQYKKEESEFFQFLSKINKYITIQNS